MTRPEPPERLSPRAKKIFGRQYARLAFAGRWEPIYASGLALFSATLADYLTYCEAARGAKADEEAALWRRMAADIRPRARELAAEYLAIAAGRRHLAKVNEHGDDADLANLE
jgi:phage terminase small subunit